MSAPTSRQSALTLLTIAADDGVYGTLIGELLSASLEPDIIEQGDLMSALRHIAEVMAELAWIGSRLARTIADIGEIPVATVLQEFVETTAD